MLAELPVLPATYDPVKAAGFYVASKDKTELPDDLPNFTGSRFRIKLPGGDPGPRAQWSSIARYMSQTIFLARSRQLT
jgi:hypothetical protein